jgi:hypothetical protein
MPELFSAHLRTSSENYVSWSSVFPTGSVPLKSARSYLVNLGEEKSVEVYDLNLQAMTLRQRARLLSFLAQKFGEPVYAVEAEIERKGFPIRASDVVVTIDVRAFA